MGKRKKKHKDSDRPKKKRRKIDLSDLENVIVDLVADFANVTHHKPFSGDVPEFRYCSKGAYIMGLAELDLLRTTLMMGQDIISKLDISNISSTNRYFSLLQTLRFRDKQFEHVRLGARQWDPHGVRQGLIQTLLPPDPELQDSQDFGEAFQWEDPEVRSQTLDAYKYQLTSELNGQTRSNPMNVENWCSLADFQQFTHKKQGQNQRVLQIYRKALEYNPASERLLVRYLRVASGIPEQADILWDQMLREHTNKPLIFKEYFQYRLSLPTYSLSKHREICAYCMKVLRAARSKLVAKTKFHDGHGFFYDLSSIEETCWTVFHHLLVLERQSGYTERATAMIQAILEFNWFAPPHLLTFEERLKYFEAFWESEAPRIGDPGARGWRQWQYLFSQGRHQEEPAQSWKKGTLADSKHFIWSSKNNHLIPKNLPPGSVNRWVRSWLEREEALGVENWRPFQGDPNQTDDFERFVMLEDIREFLFEASDETLKQKIIVDALEIMGVDDKVLGLGLRNQSVSSSPVELFETLPEISGVVHPYVSPDEASELLRKQYQMADVQNQSDALDWLNDNLGKKPTQSFLKASYGIEIRNQHTEFGWRMFRLLQESKLETLCLKGLAIGLEDSIQGTDAARALAKKFLKAESTNLRLWDIYAELELNHGKLKEARKVYKTALKLLRNVPESESRYAPLLFWKYFDLEVSRSHDLHSVLQKPLCWNLLLSCAEGAYVPLKKSANMAAIAKPRILRAEQRFSQLLDSQADMIWKLDLIKYRNQQYSDLGSVPVPAGVYLGFCYAYLTLFVSDVSKAKDIIESKVLPRLTPGFSMDWTLAQLQVLVQRGVQVRAESRAVVSRTLLKGLRLSPHNTVLLAGMLTQIAAISRFKLGLFFDGLLSATNDAQTNVLGYLYLIVYEIKCNSDPNRIRSLFEKCIATEEGRGLVALWRLYTVLELNGWDRPDRIPNAVSIAKDVWYRAVHACPWSKQLWLDGFRWFGPLFLEDELMELFKLMSEKDVRLRAKVNRS